jgi:hypothetical protein
MFDIDKKSTGEMIDIQISVFNDINDYYQENKYKSDVFEDWSLFSRKEIAENNNVTELFVSECLEQHFDLI